MNIFSVLLGVKASSTSVIGASSIFREMQYSILENVKETGCFSLFFSIKFLDENHIHIFQQQHAKLSYVNVLFFLCWSFYWPMSPFLCIYPVSSLCLFKLMASNTDSSLYWFKLHVFLALIFFACHENRDTLKQLLFTDNILQLLQWIVLCTGHLPENSTFLGHVYDIIIARSNVIYL